MTRILVVEDEAPILENILEALELEGYEVRGAANGRLGLELVRSMQPELIICDITMPVMNGYEMLLHVRSDSETASIPFIFLTANVDRASMRLGMESGADDYITKPFRIDELLTAIESRLERQKLIVDEYEDQLAQLRGTIIHALPHELRTPLTSILGYSELIMLDAEMLDKDQIVEMVTTINQNGQRLYHLTENFLVYTQTEVIRQDAERLHSLRSQRMSHPRDLIMGLALAQAERSNRSADLRLDVADVPALQIVEENLRKIVEELVSNAFKFSKPGNAVSISGGPQGDQYRLVITDHGLGMSAKEIARIEAYVQFERRLYEQQGAGLGLVISRRLAELHGGALTITSTPKEGTTIEVSLPIHA